MRPVFPDYLSVSYDYDYIILYSHQKCLLLMLVNVKHCYVLKDINQNLTKNKLNKNATRCNNRDDLVHLISFTLKISVFSEAYI